MTDTNYNEEILKTLGIDASNVTRVVLQIEAGRMPCLLVTRVFDSKLYGDNGSVYTYDLTTKGEHPMVPLSMHDAREALALFEVSKRGDC